MSSKTPQIMGGTQGSYSGTEPPLCHSLKSKAFVSRRSKKSMRKLHFICLAFTNLIRNQIYSDDMQVCTHLSCVMCLMKVIVAKSFRCPGHFLSIDNVLCIVPFTGERLITEVILSFDLTAEDSQC